MPISLSFSILKSRLSSEIRNYWYSRTSFKYTERWWHENDRINNYARITEYDGDNTQVFSSIDISPEKYLETTQSVLWSIRGNAIINIVTEFESYLYLQLKRAIYVDPSIIDRSEIELSASDLSRAFLSEDPKDVIAEEIVRKYIRNKSHFRMIKKIDSLIRGGIATGQTDLVERWIKKTTLRNALIHNSRKVNAELINAWPELYTSIGENIELDDGNVVRTHFTAFKLAEELDKQFQRTISIHDYDANALARVIYLTYREKSPGDIANAVYRILNIPFNKNNADSAIAYQVKKREFIPDFMHIQKVATDFFEEQE